MKQAYKSINFQAAKREFISTINGVIGEYQRQGYVLSVRQLYYQLVARGIIPNNLQSYKRTADVINDGRMAGLIDWDAIEDRNRDIVKRPAWTSGASIIESAARSFHMDMWTPQDCRVFVIVEKAALAGVLERICHGYDVPLLAARGYPSVSIVRELVLEHFKNPLKAGQRIKVLHLGDHDPSGLDMTRDLTERIEIFAEHRSGGIELTRLALNMDQIEELDPPPNPAKATDSRFEEYMAQFGTESWELDALEPAYLSDLVTRHIKEHIDESMWEERKTEIEEIRDRLNDTAREWEDNE